MEYAALIEALHRSLSERWMPEMVVKAILDARQYDYEHAERTLLEQARPRYTWSSMSTRYAKADDLTRMLKCAQQLFGDAHPNPADQERVGAYINDLQAQLGVTGLDFKKHRLNASERAALSKRNHPVPEGRRAYNKRFRLVARMAAKFEKCGHVANLRELAQFGHSRLASRIALEDLQEVETACFVAYLAARLNKRSTFTFGKQERAFDEIAEMLFKRLKRLDENHHSHGFPWKEPGWLAVARVYPQPEVLADLSHEDQGRLLGEWYAVMVRAAKVLKETAAANDVDMRTLIVKRGNDSSTWNEAAGAFNKAREGWINTLYAIGGEGLLDHFAPGKALRLMAADVVRGHAMFGSGGLEPDTGVWNDLPKPWEVMIDGLACTRKYIETACAKRGIEGKGWIAPRPSTVVEFKPTPELVHGVTVSSPALASVLRSVGAFAGPSKWKDVVMEDDAGIALGWEKRPEAGTAR